MQNNSGTIRGMDEAGRIVIPISARKELNAGAHDEFIIYTEDNKIILEKQITDTSIKASMREILRAVESKKEKLGKSVVEDTERIFNIIKSAMTN